MADESLGSGKVLEKTGDTAFVEVMFAKSLIEAADCKTLLQSHDIPAQVEIDSQVAKRCGIAILVPSDRLIEASELLASRAEEDEDFDDYEDDDEEEDEEFDDDDYDDDDYEDEEVEDDDLDDDFDEEEGEE